jgi:hypothetical protein
MRLKHTRPAATAVAGTLTENREPGTVADAFGPRDAQVLGALDNVISGDFNNSQVYTATTDPSCG